MSAAVRDDFLDDEEALDLDLEDILSGGDAEDEVWLGIE